MIISNQNRNGFRFCQMEGCVIMRIVRTNDNLHKFHKNLIPCDNHAHLADFGVIWNSGIAVSIHNIYCELFAHARRNGINGMNSNETKKILSMMPHNGGWFKKETLLLSKSWEQSLEIFTSTFLAWENPYFPKSNAS